MMNSKERMKLAMALSEPDRVPVMCQLAIGHYFIYSGVDPLDIWFTSEGFADALIKLRKRYEFDGILINLPGRNPEYKKYINTIEDNDNGKIIHWKNGGYTIFPADDLPSYQHSMDYKNTTSLDDIEPDMLYYIEPYDITGISYPYRWCFEEELRSFDDFFPDYHVNTIRSVKQAVGKDISIHAEIFSPWSQLLELLGYENILMAIMDDPGKIKACLERLSDGAADLAKRQAAENIDAILISSAFAGGGFISANQYDEFIVPCENKVIEEVKKKYSIPVYTHTCGKIGDRLENMLSTGTNGIDTLDPPPLGNVELVEAKKTLLGRAFIKGNIDPVNVMHQGDQESITKNVIETINIGKLKGGYILSTACSVSPHTSPENIELLSSLAKQYGKY